ncbi:MAG: ribonuclease Z [Lachnospiraceae bacterium]|nr:ribonuclease Z [Lachnospiraceae bacterium]
MLDVCLLGTSGMMPLPGRYLTSLMTRFNGSSLLIDCGEGTQVTIRRRGWSMHDIDTICFTHYHGDHIGGLPGLLLSMANADRKESVKLYGPPGLKKIVNSLRVIAPGLPYELEFHEFEKDVEHFEANGYEITAFKVNHNVTCYGYTVDISRAGKFIKEKADENRVPMKAWNLLQKGENVLMDGITYTPDMVLGPPRKGLKVTYCTDTRPTDSLRENAKGADIFICEGMYGDPEKQADANSKKHMMMQEACEIARDAEVKELWLTHYSPSLVHPEQYSKELKKIFPETICTKDRRTVDLMFEED